MEKIEGIVQGLNVKEERYGLKLSDNNWYNAFGPAQYEDESEIQKGDKVKIEYNIKGMFKNIAKIEKVGESFEKEADLKAGKDFFKPADEYYKNRDESIIRQLSAKCACWIVAGLLKSGQAYTFEGTMDTVKKYTNAIEKEVILGE